MDPSSTLATPGTIQAVVGADADGARIDVFLSAFCEDADLPNMSRSQWKRLLTSGHVTLDGAVVKPSAHVKHGQVVTLSLPEMEASPLTPEDEPLDVVFEDDAILVVNKPAGLVVHPGPGHPGGTLVNRLLAHCRFLSQSGGVERPGIVHRLDKDTSGLMVVAKTDQAHLGLASQFADRRVHKQYVAFCIGNLPDAGTIETLYGRHPNQRLRFTSRVESGQSAITEYRVTHQRGGLLRVEVTLHTGRTHQIRVHLSENDAPIACDKLYGRRHPEKHLDKDAAAAVRLVSRQALHAATLGFAHPRDGKALMFEALLPEDLLSLDAFCSRP